MLGLLYATDVRWASAALADLDAVLRDHAHCEMKAASHALSLAARHPDDLGLVRKLVALAQEELAHFDRALEILASRGIALGAPPVDEYAATLRARTARLAPLGVPRGVLVDRLLVASLIEARSCERFKLLAAAMAPKDAKGHELHAFYEELFAAEARHFSELVDLATVVSGAPGVVERRFAEIAALEADIVRGQDIVAGSAGASATSRATIHG